MTGRTMMCLITVPDHLRGPGHTRFGGTSCRGVIKENLGRKSGALWGAWLLESYLYPNICIPNG